MRSFVSVISTIALLVVLLVPAFAKDVQVKEYTKKNGTVVNAYTRTVKDKQADTVKVKGYTKANGTKVAGYERKKTSKPTGTK